MTPPTELKHAVFGPNVIYYHAGCMDGFMAAWSAWKFLGNDHTIYIPYRPHQKTPDADGRHAIFVDIAPDRAILEDPSIHLLSLRILDHHHTSKDEWDGTPYMVFSDSKSAAWIAWDFFHPDRRVPRLITYVSDRDTWARALPRSEDLMTNLWMTPLYTKGSPNFELWDSIVQDIDTDEGFDRACLQGQALRPVIDRHIAISASKARPCEVLGIPMWVLNDPTPHRSMVADTLLERPFPSGDMPKAVMVWYYHIPSQKFTCSLRSSPTSGVDVAALAKRFGGGGRTYAAAFRWDGDIRLLLQGLDPSI